MSIEALIKTAFSEVLKPEIWKEFSAGKLLIPEFKKDLKLGDEIDVIFNSYITTKPYTGGNLNPNDAEKVSNSTVKVKVNNGISVFFELDDAKIRQINNAKTNEERIKIATEFSDDAKKQFAREVNKATCGQYVRAGHVITGAGGAAITVSVTNVHQIFAKAKSLLKKGDGKGHTAWVGGEMVAIISADLEAYMSTQNLLQYSDEMAKHYKEGYAGKFMGFDVIVDDDVAKDVNGYEYPLFGRAGKTIAGGVQDELELESGKPYGGFDTGYWGKGVFGVKAPLAYLLCTAKLNVDFAIGA